MSELTPIHLRHRLASGDRLVRRGVPRHGEGQAVPDGRRAGWPRRAEASAMRC